MSQANASSSSSTPDALKVKICQGHTRPVCHINYSNIVDGSYWFVTSCHDAKPMLRNGETGDWVGTFEGHRGAVYCSSFNSDATRVVTGSGDYTAMLWDAISGQKLGEWVHPHYVKACDWWEARIATGNYDGKLRLFDATRPGSDALTSVTVNNDKKGIKSVYMIPQSSCIVTACESQIALWDLRSPNPGPAREVDVPGLTVLDYTHKNALVASHGKSITMFLPNLEQRGSITTNEDVDCASLSPNGRFICAGSKIKVKEYTVDGTTLQSNPGHHGPIFHVRYAPDGSGFTSGSEDSMVRVWPSHETMLKHGAVSAGGGSD